MSTFGSFNTAVTALQAHRRAIDVVGNNVANAQTDGYVRRRVDLRPAGSTTVPGVFARPEIGGGGVEASTILRLRDELLASRVTREYSVQGRVDTEKATFDRIQNLLPEPSDNGLTEQLTAFWGAWDDAANLPNDTSLRAALLERGDALASSMRQTASRIEDLRDGGRDGAVATVKEINDLAAQVARLNERIVASNSGGGDANDLLDERDRLITRLSEQVDITTKSGDFGSMDVYVGGSTLVRLNSSFALNVVESGSLPPPANTTGLNRVSVQWAADGSEPRIAGGRLAGHLATANDIVPNVIVGLDTVAQRLVTTINSLHTTGFGRDNVSGRTFLDPTGTRASTINISADVAGQPDRIALSGVAGAGLDASVGRAIGALVESTTGADASYRTMIGRLGVDARSTTLAADLQESVLNAVRDDYESVSGVSMDEELAAMVQHQRAYEAAARVLTTVDQTLDILINRTGLVGR